jgi:hypothetical protein
MYKQRMAELAAMRDAIKKDFLDDLAASSALEIDGTPMRHDVEAVEDMQGFGAFLADNLESATLPAVVAERSMSAHDDARAFLGDPVLQQRLAKYMVLQCFRNSLLEDLHAGISPSSAAGDYSDVTVSSPYGVIPWPKVSRLNDVLIFYHALTRFCFQV